MIIALFIIITQGKCSTNSRHMLIEIIRIFLENYSIPKEEKSYTYHNFTTPLTPGVDGVADFKLWSALEWNVQHQLI